MRVKDHGEAGSYVTNVTVSIEEAISLSTGKSYHIAEAHYYHTNVQGNTAALTNADGAVRQSYAYDLYGRLTAVKVWNGSALVSIGDADAQGNC